MGNLDKKQIGNLSDSRLPYDYMNREHGTVPLNPDRPVNRIQSNHHLDGGTIGIRDNAALSKLSDGVGINLRDH